MQEPIPEQSVSWVPRSVTDVNLAMKMVLLMQFEAMVHQAQG
jgi:hypothetical protein